jgi:hypothetical protein
MLGRRALQTNVFAALMLVGATCVAALFAHVGIDLAGDVVLAHDTYDGLDHRSRSEALIVSLALLFGALLRVAWLALDEARTGRAAARPSFDDVFGRERWRFIFTVVALTLPVLVTMELFDIVADGRRLDDVADLLGGSVWLGLGITIPFAALVAQAVRSIAKLVMSSHRALVTVIGRLFALLARLHRQVEKRTPKPSVGILIHRRSILSRPSGTRGPPLRSTERNGVASDAGGTRGPLRATMSKVRKRHEDGIRARTCVCRVILRG